MRNRSGRYRDVIAWQRSYRLALDVYQTTRQFPADEKFGLTQQSRRAAVSVPSNIAEGWGRGTRNDYVRFLGMARGSLYELDTQLNIAADLGYFEQEDEIFDQLDEAERVLNGLIRSLKTDKDKTPRP